MLSGYTGKILWVNLSNRKISTTEFDEKFAKKYIGGNGFGIKLLIQECPTNINPLAPENVFILALGPFVLTSTPTSSKYSVYSKSPLTGFLGEGIASGFFGNHFKAAGYDVLVVHGRHPSLCYLWIDDDEIQIGDAEHLKGIDTWTVETTLREELDDPQIEVAAIGIAGEKLVRFACITNARSRQVGRTGLGAVMGSKNLKALAVRGTSAPYIAYPEKLLTLCHDIYKRCQGSATEKYRLLGTPVNIMAFNELGALPTRNFQQSTFEQAEEVSGERLSELYVDQIISCGNCPIACDHISRVKDGPFKGAEAGVDFETIFAFGPNLGIGRLDAIIKANEICDRVGIDTMSVGGTIAFAMECFERGIISKMDTNGFDLSFGNYENVLILLELISERKGIGNILAEGSRRAAQIIGKGAERYAMHIKGLELPGYAIRGLKTAALGFATSTRGGCHLRSGAYSFDMKGKVDRYTEELGRGILIKEAEDLYSIFDSLILCKFIRGAVTTEEIAQMYTFTTGIHITVKELLQAGERIYTLEKLFNLREGATRADDFLPERMFSEPIPDGPAKGNLIRRKGYESMLEDYYTSRGWTKEGIPTKEKLLELDILDQYVVINKKSNEFER
ncbi:MAG: aldehyde ferredoxin oxidoreductase family protein [Promethearchaeota archaeon]